MDKKKAYLSLKKFCLNQGMKLFGVADISGIKKDFMFSKRLLDKVDRAISLGARLSGGILTEVDKNPTQLYYRNYRTLNTLLDITALKLANLIQDQGFLAIPIPASQVVDWKLQKGHLSHKKIAQLAGLGWIGRNNLLVNKELGSQIRIASVLTDIPLLPDKPNEFNCGACRRCVESCPAKAIKDNPSDFDYAGCFEKIKEFHRKRFAEQYICGVCVNACRGIKR